MVRDGMRLMVEQLEYVWRTVGQKVDQGEHARVAEHIQSQISAMKSSTSSSPITVTQMEQKILREAATQYAPQFV